MAKGSETGGCLNCYAARLSARNLPEMRSPTTGESFARILESGPRWTGKVELIEKALPLPLGWRKARRIFVNSLSDLFHEALPDEAIDRVFAVMALCPQHSFQVLTKRPERMLKYIGADYSGRRGNGVYPESHSRRRIEKIAPSSTYEHACEAGYENRRWPLPNVWLGVSIENQTTADARIPLLLRTPAAHRFISYEPALGPVDLTPYLLRRCSGCGIGAGGQHRPSCERQGLVTGDSDYRGMNFLDWVIIGGESGPGARLFDVRWAHDTIRACQAAGVPVFVKQLGAKPHHPARPDCLPVEMALTDRKGGDMDEWPPEVCVREMPA